MQQAQKQILIQNIACANTISSKHAVAIEVRHMLQALYSVNYAA